MQFRGHGKNSSVSVSEFVTHDLCFTKRCLKRQSQNRVATGQGKVREILFYFKVREKSGNLQNGQGSFKYQESWGKVRNFLIFWPELFGCDKCFIHFVVIDDCVYFFSCPLRLLSIITN